MEQLVDNRYHVTRPLGSGGMAEVYLARDAVLDREVALKVMSRRYADDDEFVERFKREAQSAAALSHPNIVSIYDRGESEDGTYYIAMEYLCGGTLKDRILKRGALPPGVATAVALQIAEALQAAHQAGVVHRDIKPHNVLVTASGDVKVGDFGIARAASSSTMTRTGSILGTAHYISPEQAMGEPVGPQSDLYSLGIVLYEMLTGELPYDAETSIGIAMKHVSGYLVPPRELNPKIPEGINAITFRLLAKNPEERYADAGELMEDLEKVLEGSKPAAMEKTSVMNRIVPGVIPAGMARTHAMPAYQTTENNGRYRRRRRWVPILLLLLLTLLGGMAYAIAQELLTEEVEVPDLVGATSIEEAQALAGEDFTVEVEDDSVKSREPAGTIVDQSPLAGKMADWRSTIYVDVSGAQMADLPNVEGEAREEAVGLLEEAGFEVEEETGESSVEDEGYVTGQAPRGGGSATAEAGSTVTITVGAGPTTVEVPDLSSLTPDKARQALEEAGLKLGSRTEASSERVKEGQISSQNPGAGEQAKEGASVDITVSSGTKQVKVPNVVGSLVGEARQTLWASGFDSTVETVQSSAPAGTVVSTDPSAGTSLDPYSNTVTIRQSSGPPQPAATETSSSYTNAPSYTYTDSDYTGSSYVGSSDAASGDADSGNNAASSDAASNDAASNDAASNNATSSDAGSGNANGGTVVTYYYPTTTSNDSDDGKAAPRNNRKAGG